MSSFKVKLKFDRIIYCFLLNFYNFWIVNCVFLGKKNKVLWVFSMFIYLGYSVVDEYFWVFFMDYIYRVLWGLKEWVIVGVVRNVS